MPARLRAVAGWDVAVVRRSAMALDGVAERLPTWRVRLEGVARTLDEGSGWAGPAARTAAAVARDLSAGTWAVGRALAESLQGIWTVSVEAGAAQVLAREALVLADAVPEGAVGPSPAAAATASDAVAHAAAVAAAAERARDALTRVGVRDSVGPADLAALGAWVPLASPVCVPSAPPGPPDRVAAWWAALPITAQLAALRADPAGLGHRDGLPAWARDRANRLLLADALDDPHLGADAADMARALARRIQLEERGGQQVQLHLLDLTGDRVVLALGDLDAADAVALVVPGINNSPGDDLDRLVADAHEVAGAARAAAPDLAFATAVWLGYDSPSRPDRIIRRRDAVAGGAALAPSLAGLREGREAVAAAVARTSVLAHSYGTVVVDEAADEPGELAADAVVLLGSPGMEDDAASLEVPEVYDAAAPRDWIVASGWFGGRTSAPAFGSTALPVGVRAGHSDYYDPDLPTLAAVGEVVAGVRGPG